METYIGTIEECPWHGGWCLRTAKHDITAKREAVVHGVAMDMNAKGVDFQPGQQWTGKRRRTRRAS